MGGKKTIWKNQVGVQQRLCCGYMPIGVGTIVRHLSSILASLSLFLYFYLFSFLSLSFFRYLCLSLSFFLPCIFFTFFLSFPLYRFLSLFFPTIRLAFSKQPLGLSKRFTHPYHKEFFLLPSWDSCWEKWPTSTPSSLFFLGLEMRIILFAYVAQ